MSKAELRKIIREMRRIKEAVKPQIMVSITRTYVGTRGSWGFMRIEQYFRGSRFIRQEIHKPESSESIKKLKLMSYL